MGDTTGYRRQMDIRIGTGLVGFIQTYCTCDESSNDILNQMSDIEMTTIVFYDINAIQH